MTPVKTCTLCGAAITAAEWATLPRCGALDVPADDTGPAEVHEYRNHTCGTTLAVVLEPVGVAS